MYPELREVLERRVERAGEGDGAAGHGSDAEASSAPGVAEKAMRQKWLPVVTFTGNTILGHSNTGALEYWNTGALEH